MFPGASPGRTKKFAIAFQNKLFVDGFLDERSKNHEAAGIRDQPVELECSGGSCGGFSKAASHVRRPDGGRPVDDLQAPPLPCLNNRQEMQQNPGFALA